VFGPRSFLFAGTSVLVVELSSHLLTMVNVHAAALIWKSSNDLRSSETATTLSLATATTFHRLSLVIFTDVPVVVSLHTRLNQVSDFMF